MSLMAASSSCGSAHGLETVRGDQLAVRRQENVSGHNGRVESWRNGGRRMVGNEGGGTAHTTDVRGNEMTAQCHAPALRQRLSRPRGYGSYSGSDSRD